jgi:hypothetical protein
MPKTDEACPICGDVTNPIFRKIILGKYQVEYLECRYCGLVKTETPHWLEEAYTSAIADMDTGLVHRNIEMSKAASRIIEAKFDAKGVFLDYAGGYGLFVRLMRDKGFDFYWHDKYCSNIFARQFSKPDGQVSFELVTAFEFLEHVFDPLKEVGTMADLSDNILFTTEIRPDTIDEMSNWWYLVPETGQHVLFYTVMSLEILAQKLGMHFYSNFRNIHLFSKDARLDPFSERKASSPNFIHRLSRRFRRTPDNQNMGMESLTWKDHIKVRDSLRKTQKGKD